MSYGDNLPPGVTERMIPGNRPEDVLADEILDRADDDALAEFYGNDNGLNAALPSLMEKDEGGYAVEDDDLSTQLDLRDEDEAVSYVLVAYEDVLVDAYVEAELEAARDRWYDEGY